MGGRGNRVSLVDRQTCIGLVSEARRSGASRCASCQLLGLSLRTLERWEKDPREDARQGPKTQPANSLTPEETAQVISISNSEAYRDLNPHQIVVALADKQQYVASECTFYRILKKNHMLVHRLKSKPKTQHPPRELIATAPNQVWSWDITYLPSLIRGVHFYLYLIEDVFSRMIIGWRIEERESATLSADLVSECCRKHNISRNQISLHADNGGAMKGATMLSTLVRLGVDPSFSRPSVSNDNPFSESLFRTVKYGATFPNHFKNIEASRVWMMGFEHWYTHEHLHSQISYVTPFSRHYGLDSAILMGRKEVYNLAKSKHPHRWSGGIRNWNRINKVILNPGKEKKRQPSGTPVFSPAQVL